jgi:hypothetical protein
MIDATSVYPNRKCRNLFDKLKGKGKNTHDYPSSSSTPTPEKKQPNPQSSKPKPDETPPLSSQYVPNPKGNIDHPSQPQKEETPFSPPIIKDVPNSSKQDSKSDEIAEKYWPLMLIAVVCLGLVILFTKVCKKLSRPGLC